MRLREWHCGSGMLAAGTIACNVCEGMQQRSLQQRGLSGLAMVLLASSRVGTSPPCLGRLSGPPTQHTQPAFTPPRSGCEGLL